MTIGHSTARQVGGVDGVAAQAAADGSAAHPHAIRLATGTPAAADLADAVHAICALHGHSQGMLEHARARQACPDAVHWLENAATRFAAERAALARLAAASGPVPSTPGQAATQATIVAQRHALDTLAGSERCGCALGAAAALIADWPAIRAVLCRAAYRFDVALLAADLPDATETERVLALVASSPAAERAILFGADQVLAQHRGLWSLLESRSEARRRD